MFAAAVYDGDSVRAFGGADIRIDGCGDFQDSLWQRRFVRLIIVRKRLGLPAAKMMAIAAVANFVEDGDRDVVAGSADAVADGDFWFLDLQTGRRFTAK